VFILLHVLDNLICTVLVSLQLKLLSALPEGSVRSNKYLVWTP